MLYTGEGEKHVQAREPRHMKHQRHEEFQKRAFVRE
jgi:hypothetical protein